MHEDVQKCRQQVIEHVALLASASEQIRYEREVPIADVPAELVSCFCDDLFHPKQALFVDAFTEQELKSLAELYGMLCIACKAIEEHDCHQVTELQKIPAWRSVMAFAKDLETWLRRASNQPKQ